ncbi:MAG: mechanosensitive ion channel family protein [Acidimicrobiales bacterium]
MLIAQQDEPAEPGSDIEQEISDSVDSELTVVLDRWSTGQVDWPDLAAAIGVIAVAALLAYAVRRGIRRSARELDGVSSTALNLVGQLVSVGLYAFAIAIALGMLGFTAGPVLVLLALGFVLLIVFRPMIANLSSGLFLQLRGYCRPGDVVAIDGEVGTVNEVNTRSVIVDTVDGRTAIIPNDKAIAAKIINYSWLGQRRSHITFRLPADADLVSRSAQVREALVGLENVLTEPPPRLVVTGFDGPQIWVEVHFWTRPSIEAEIAGRDQVGRALTALFQAGTAPGDASSIVQLVNQPR